MKASLTRVHGSERPPRAPHRGLCGNHGKILLTVPAPPCGYAARFAPPQLDHFCICPNGRVMKRKADHATRKTAKATSMTIRYKGRSGCTDYRGSEKANAQEELQEFLAATTPARTVCTHCEPT